MCASVCDAACVQGQLSRQARNHLIFEGCCEPLPLTPLVSGCCRCRRRHYSLSPQAWLISTAANGEVGAEPLWTYDSPTSSADGMVPRHLCWSAGHPSNLAVADGNNLQIWDVAAGTGSFAIASWSHRPDFALQAIGCIRIDPFPTTSCPVCKTYSLPDATKFVWVDHCSVL